jgi:hypothetical protein
MNAGEDRGPVPGLSRVFTPAQAAQALRDIGLENITECALRTRAYRKQIPFHLNGNRIIFTIDDLREIAQGTPRRPRPATDPSSPPATPSSPRPAPRRMTTTTTTTTEPDSWRSKRPRHAS